MGEAELIFDREFRISELELDELIRGDGTIRVRANDSMGRETTFHSSTGDQPRIGDKVRIAVTKVASV